MPAKSERHAREREGDREARHQEAADADEHEADEIFVDRHTPGPRSSGTGCRRAFQAAQHEDRPHQHGKPLERQHQREGEQQGFQQPEGHEGAFRRAFQHAHGGADIGQPLPGHHGAERPQEDEHADAVDQRLALRRGRSVEDVHPDMAVMQQRVAGAGQEQDGVHEQHRFLHRDEAESEHVAQQHHGELHQHQEEGEPGHDPAQMFVPGVDRPDEDVQCAHRHSPLASGQAPCGWDRMPGRIRNRRPGPRAGAQPCRRSLAERSGDGPRLGGRGDGACNLFFPIRSDTASRQRRRARAGAARASRPAHDGPVGRPAPYP